MWRKQIAALALVASICVYEVDVWMHLPDAVLVMEAKSLNWFPPVEETVDWLYIGELIWQTPQMHDMVEEECNAGDGPKKKTAPRF